MRKFLRSVWLIITAPFRFIAWIFRSIKRALRRLFAPIIAFFTEEEEDTPLVDAISKTVENPSAILFHLNALRKHLFRAVLVVFLAAALSFSFIHPILEFLAAPLQGGLEELRAIDVTENVGTVMRVTLLAGFAIALPYVVFEVYLFIAPGLKARSRVRGLLAIPFAILFFLAGMAFAFYVMLPVALPFLFNFMGLVTQPRPSSYFNFVTGIVFWIGLFFEFPLLAFFLADFGLLRAKVLAQQWRLAFVIIAVIAAAVTPTVDPINMSLVMAPLIVLYLLSILLAYLARAGRDKSARQNQPVN